MRNSKRSRPGTSSLKANLPSKGERREPSSKGSLLPTEERLRNDCEATIKDTHESYTGLSTAFREVLWDFVAAGCSIAAFLEGDEEAWSTFCSNPIWDDRKARPNSQKPDQALRFVLLRISGLTKEGAKRASKWLHAVQPLVAKGVEPEDIRAAIKKGGGIEALARRNAQVRRSKATTRSVPVKKPLVAKKTSHGEAIKRGPTAKSYMFVDLRAKLVQHGTHFLSLPKGGFANLTIRMVRIDRSKFEIAIFKAERAPPVLS